MKILKFSRPQNQDQIPWIKYLSIAVVAAAVIYFMPQSCKNFFISLYEFATTKWLN